MYFILLVYSLCYMPTMALTNALAFRQMKDPKQDFGSIRVLGTAGWIVAGLLIGYMGGALATNITHQMPVNTYAPIYIVFLLMTIGAYFRNPELLYRLKTGKA